MILDVGFSAFSAIYSADHVSLRQSKSNLLDGDNVVLSRQCYVLQTH